MQSLHPSHPLRGTHRSGKYHNNEHEALCKLHTTYNYPGRFGTKGRCFYYIADRCIPKVHHFWTRRREKEIWLAMQYAKWKVAVKPVSKPLRFFKEHGELCNVPTDDLCNIGVKTDRSRVISGPDEGGLKAVWSKPAEDEKVSAFIKQNKLSSRYQESRCRHWTQENRFHKLAVECRIAQVAAKKGIKTSQDGSVYSEFLTQVQSMPEVWQGVLHAQKGLPTEISNSIEAMFTVEGRKKGFLNSLTASVRRVVDYDASEKIVTLSPENVTALPTTSQVGAIIGGIAHKAGRPSSIPCWSDSDFHICPADWGKSNDDIDWDALTNGNINGNVD